MRLKWIVVLIFNDNFLIKTTWEFFKKLDENSSVSLCFLLEFNLIKHYTRKTTLLLSLINSAKQHAWHGEKTLPRIVQKEASSLLF